jgi:hypothetical protein
MIFEVSETSNIWKQHFPISWEEQEFPEGLSKKSAWTAPNQYIWILGVDQPAHVPVDQHLIRLFGQLPLGFDVKDFNLALKRFLLHFR